MNLEGSSMPGQSSMAKKSRAQKKRAKGQQANAASGPLHSFPDPLAVLRHEMDIARQKNDHAAMNVLRQRIWLLQDAAAGVHSDVTTEQLDKILKSSSCINKTPDAAPRPMKPIGLALSFAHSHEKVLQKKLRKLKKKKTAIEELKVRKESGAKMEKAQLEKIEREKFIDVEISEVESELLQLQHSEN